MSFDYDTLDAGPSTAVEQTQSTVFVDGAPWRIFEMKIPSDGTKKYIRSGPIAGADLKTYDFGRVWVSAEGCADDSAHGYLELEYRVSLFEKQTSAIGNSFSNRCWSSWNLSSDTAVLSASATLDISEQVIVASSDTPTNTSGVVTLTSAGYYEVTLEYSYLLGSSSGTNTSTIEIRVDGASQAVPALGYLGKGTADLGNGSITCLVLSDGTTTVEAYYSFSNYPSTFYGDRCRLIVCAK
jgi:hypothetical protein